jgi:D-serine deaminase-like pyridoxal phosphate-dependent protein
MNKVRNSHALPSPALLFFEDAIRANFREAIRIAGTPSRLRPHVKTHKTAEISAMAMSYGIDKFKCATIAEAEMLARTGAPDILLSYTLVGRNAERLVELAAKYPHSRFSTIVDDMDSAKAIDTLAHAAGMRLGAFLDLDIGQHRTGIAAGHDAASLYAYLARESVAGKQPGRAAGLFAAGLHCYDGHNHQHDLAERTTAAEACYGIMDGFRTALRNAGLPVPEVVMGGTPTFPCYAAHDDVILSPGTCFLHDYSYASSFPDLKFEHAALIMARVVSRNAGLGTFTIDLGYKGISADPKGLRGLLLGFEESTPVLQNEEHWVFPAPARGLPEIGEEVYVIPTHICPTVALYERAHIVDGQGVCYAEWKIASRDRSIGI